MGPILSSSRLCLSVGMCEPDEGLEDGHAIVSSFVIHHLENERKVGLPRAALAPDVSMCRSM